MAGVVSRFSNATATTIEETRNSSQNQEHCEKYCFLASVWKKWFLEKEITHEIENYEPAELRETGNFSF